MDERKDESRSLPRWLEVTLTLFALNWITICGATLTTTSALLFMGTFAVGILGIIDSPYIGIVGFLIVPGIFVAGLAIIPLGAYLHRRKIIRLHRLAGIEEKPQLFIDFNRQKTRDATAIVAFLTAINFAILSVAAYKGVTHMNSVQFCGITCHSVMEPEYTAYLQSPHSRVNCVKCHIGPGASWFVRSKLSGARQVFATAFGTHSRPIPTPVSHLRPARETCEQCHWPERFTGDRLRVISTFEEDEENTELTTALLMHIGGGTKGGGGIHSWHIDPLKKTEYFATDPQRQVIPYVRVTRADGSVAEFITEDADIDPDQIPEGELRTMDCMDCHNRPAHTFHMPATALNLAMAQDRIDTSLPYIRKVALEALEATAQGENGENDLSSIARYISTYYEENYSDLDETKTKSVDQAISAVQDIYARNVFPIMGVSWGTYDNNIGHTNSAGCFRCHDDAHLTKNDEAISQDCTLCHAMLAWDEEDPSILAELGL